MFWKICIALLLLAALCSCQRSPESGASNRAENGAAEKGSEEAGAPRPVIKLTSAAFQEGGSIPKKYTCDDANASPPLAWDVVPPNAKTIALIADDPDAPRGTWVHWVLFNLPASARELRENVPTQDKISGGGAQGTNDFKRVGYGGPCPPPGGPHRYFFKLYALDTELPPDSSTTKDKLLTAMQGHIVAQGQLMGKYERGKSGQ
jgi:hypothetical protein